MFVHYAVLLLLPLFAAANFKALPGAWLANLAIQVGPRMSRRGWRDRRRSKPAGLSLGNPLFDSTSFTSLCTLSEIDHNMHKSNSTFFADIDISRAKVLFSLISPAILRQDEQNLLKILEREGYSGKFGVVLGAVHMSFCKEIKAYQSYSVESKVSTWDQKWLVIESSFWRGGKMNGNDKETRTFLGKAVSKFVFKKGRFTVAPARVFQAAGLIDDGPTPSTVPSVQTSISSDSESCSDMTSWSADAVEKKRALNFQLHQSWLEYSNSIARADLATGPTMQCLNKTLL